LASGLAVAATDFDDGFGEITGESEAFCPGNEFDGIVPLDKSFGDQLGRSGNRLIGAGSAMHVSIPFKSKRYRVMCGAWTLACNFAKPDGEIAPASTSS